MIDSRPYFGTNTWKFQKFIQDSDDVNSEFLQFYEDLYQSIENFMKTQRSQKNQKYFENSK